MSQLRRSTQTHQNATRLARENWVYLRFCILSFLNLRPSHLFLIIFNTNLWDNKTMGKNIGHMCHCSLGLDLRLVHKEEQKEAKVEGLQSEVFKGLSRSICAFFR